MKRLKVSYTFPAEVVRVIDGDTVELLVDLGMRTFRKDKFRLYGINTPETYGVKKGSDEYKAGMEAKKRLKQLLPKNKEITIRTHKNTDKYGRWLCEIETEEHENVVQVLLDEGLGAEYYGGKR